VEQRRQFSATPIYAKILLKRVVPLNRNVFPREISIVVSSELLTLVIPLTSYVQRVKLFKSNLLKGFAPAANGTQTIGTTTPAGTTNPAGTTTPAGTTQNVGTTVGSTPNGATLTNAQTGTLATGQTDATRPRNAGFSLAPVLFMFVLSLIL
jgi:hypothetical protein